jgi:transposase InsO family protein
MHVRDHFSKFSAAYPMESKESESVALHLGGFIGMFGVPGILQCDNGTEFKGACDHLVKHHGIPVVHSKPRTPQTNGLIEQANGVLKTKILAWMTEMQSTEWWLALPEAMLSMNRQVHSTTGKSPYEVVFKQLRPDRPRISTAQRSTAIVLEHQESLDTIAPSIDPQLLATSTNSVDSRS